MVNVVFCLPGKSYSNNFLVAWSETLVELQAHNIHYYISNKYSSNVFFVRNMCLGGSVLSGIDQQVFDGRIDYDYIFWIDSDMVFKSTDVLRLIATMETNKELNILSGMYLMEGGSNFATVDKGNFDYKLFVENDGVFPFMNFISVICKKEQIFEAEYTGFGFICIRKGVFEKCKYPWFRPYTFAFDIEVTREDEEDEDEKKKIVSIVDYCSEDVGFCRMVQGLGFKVHVDPKIIVGHEKTHVEYINLQHVIKRWKDKGIYESEIAQLENPEQMIKSMNENITEKHS